jgi:uncharacterized protein (TIRG00374 family)
MRLRKLMTSRRTAALVGVGVLGLLLWRAGPTHVWAALTRLSIPALILSIGLNVPVTLVRAVRTRLILDRLGHRVGWGSLVRAQLAGQTLSNLTPAASGDLVRAWLWRRDDEVPATKGVAVVVYERILSLTLLIAVGGAFYAQDIGGPFVVAGICVGALAVIAVPFALTRVAPARQACRTLLTQVSRLPGLSTRTRPLQRMGGDVGVLAADGGLLITFSVTTVVVFVLSGLQIWLLATGLGGSVDVAGAVGIYGLSQAGGSLSAVPFGLGPADAVVVGLLLRSGTSFGIGTTVALLLRGTVTLPIALAAAAAMAGRPRPSWFDLTGKPETTAAPAKPAHTPAASPTPTPTATPREAPAYR